MLFAANWLNSIVKVEASTVSSIVRPDARFVRMFGFPSEPITCEAPPFRLIPVPVPFEVISEFVIVAVPEASLIP